MEYRKAKTDDIGRIEKLVSDVAKELEAHGIFQWDELYPTAEDFMSDISGGALFTVTDGDELVAIYTLNRESDEDYRNVKWECDDSSALILHRFCVSPMYQHRGIGREVLAHIEDQVRNSGFGSLRLDVFSLNPFAQSLYRKAGYTERGSAAKRKGRFDLMEKRLKS